MNFDLPKDLADYLVELDDFIEKTSSSRCENADDNIRFFDHRREDARTDWDRGGLPSEEWEALLAKARKLADDAGHYRYPLPKECGGKDGTNLGMAVIREHFAAKGLGLHNDLQNEHSIVGNNVGLLLMLHHGTEEQKKEWIPAMLAGQRGFAFGITEPDHGSDATHMETVARRDGDDWVINGEKTWNTGIHKANYDLIFARTSGKAGDGDGITAFLDADEFAGLQGRRDDLDVQHADRPRPHLADGRARAARRDLRRRRQRPAGGAAFLQREPHPAGGVEPGCRAVLHQRIGRVREGAQAVRQAAVDQSGDPVPAGRTADAVRDAARADPQDGVA